MEKPRMGMHQFIDYRKLGGWLMTLWVYGIATSVYNLGGLLILLVGASASLQLGTTTQAILIVNVTTRVLVLAFDVLMVVMISKRNKLAVGALVASNAVQIICAIVLQFLPTPDPLTYGEYLRDMGINPSTFTVVTSTFAIATLIITIAILVVWVLLCLLYFKKSQRVYVYFLTDQEFNQEYMERHAAWEQIQQASPQARPYNTQ